MFSHCEVHQKAEKVSFSNAFWYLEIQISITWWLRRTEHAQLFLVSLCSKKYCDKFQVVTNICEQYLICQFLALELASSLGRFCKWKCVYPYAPPFLEEVWGCTTHSQLGRHGAIGGTWEQHSVDSLWCLAPWKSIKDKGTKNNS